MRLSRSFLLGGVALLTAAFSANTASATQIQTFNVSGYPAASPQVQGNFTVSSSLGLAGPFQNGGLGSMGYPSTITIASNGFLFDAQSIDVGGVNSAIPSETETFIGDIYGGGTVTQTYQFPGNNVNFTTVNLNGFNDLVDLRANIGAVTLQNLTYSTSAVPEPGTLGLLSACLAAAGFVYRRKRA